LRPGLAAADAIIMSSPDAFDKALRAVPRGAQDVATRRTADKMTRYRRVARGIVPVLRHYLART
jgi:hypothetical protein